jgi:GTP:adenosylcobinamide-phosphate guanylyltransferase
MECILMAGGVPQEDDLLHEHTQGKPKALLPLAGKPMVQWVLDALEGVDRIGGIILVGLGPDVGFTSSKVIAHVSDHGSMLRNVIAGVDQLMEINPGAQQAVVCSADIPLITPTIVNDYLDQCRDAEVDLHYGAVGRELMEGRFPESRRSYIHLTDGDLAGADIFVINPRIAYSNRQLFEDLMGSRKSVLKQAGRIGWVTLLKLLLRQLSLAEAEERVCKAMGLTGRAVLVKHAELGMDVDKPFQLEIVRRELASREEA